MNSKKGFALTLVIAIIAILAIGGVVFVTQKKEVKAPIIINPIYFSCNAKCIGQSCSDAPTE